MTTVFPGALDNIANNKTDVTLMAGDHAVHHNNLADAVNMLESKLQGYAAGTQSWVNGDGALLTFKRVDALGSAVLILDNAGLTLNGGNQNTALQWRKNSLLRWIAYANGTQETGSNAGSDWSLDRASDAGATIDTALWVQRSTGDLHSNHTIYSTGQMIPTGGITLPVNATTLNFTDPSGGHPNFIAQADGSFVFYGTDATGAQRAIWSVVMHNSTANLYLATPQVVMPNGTAALPGITFNGHATDGIYNNGSGALCFAIAGVTVGAWFGNSLVAYGSLGVGSAGDTYLYRDGVGQMSLRNGTNGMLFGVYKSYTNSSTWEALQLSWNAAGNTYLIASNTAGGSLKNLKVMGNSLYLSSGAGDFWYVTSGGNFGSTSAANAVQFLLPDGSGTAPGLSFVSQTNAGFYKSAGNQFDFVVNGQDSVRFVGQSAVTQLQLPNGTVTQPALAWKTDAGASGWYWKQSQDYRYAIAGADVLGFTTTGINHYGGFGDALTKGVIFSELTTIAAAATSKTTNQIPAGAVVLGVAVYTKTAIPTATTYTITADTAGTTFSTAAIGTAAGTSNMGTAAGAWYCAVQQFIRITPNSTPASATGQVRIVVYGYRVTPPTS